MIRRTFGSVKDQLARVTQNGMCATNPQLLARLNEAQERLLNKGLYAGTYARYSICVYGGCITLPREFDSILGYNFGGSPAQVFNQWYEFMANGPGIAPAGDWKHLIDRGYAPTFRSLSGQRYIRVYTDLAEDSSATILFRGSDTFNNRIQTVESSAYIDGERLNLGNGSNTNKVLVAGYTDALSFLNGFYTQNGTENGFARYSKGSSKVYWNNSINGRWAIYNGNTSSDQTLASNSNPVLYPWLSIWNSPAVVKNAALISVNAFADVDAINKTITKGWIRVYGVDPVTGSEQIISILAPAETLPLYRRYAIPGFENEEGSTVTILAKKKFIPVVSDDDDLTITNLGALKLMLIAIEKEENNNLEEALAYEQKAVELLREELREVQGAAQGRPQVQMEAFAMGEIPAMA